MSLNVNANIFDDMPARLESSHLTESVEENSENPWIIGAIIGFLIGMGGYIVYNRFDCFKNYC